MYAIIQIQGKGNNPTGKGGEHMNNTSQEVNEMTNLETSALLEAIKIIVEKSQSIEEIKNALERIQGTLKKPQ